MYHPALSRDLWSRIQNDQYFGGLVGWC